MLITGLIKVQKGKMQLAWTNLTNAGNKSIDSQHQNLLNMVNDTENAIRARDTAALVHALKQFEPPVHIPYIHEEKIARVFNYPFEEHHLEHQYVLSELQTINDELVSSEGRWSESAVEYYYEFPSEWTSMHIGEDNMRMKEILETYPYDFKPLEIPV